MAGLSVQHHLRIRLQLVAGQLTATVVKLCLEQTARKAPLPDASFICCCGQYPSGAMRAASLTRRPICLAVSNSPPAPIPTTHHRPAACAPDEPALDGGAELRPSLSARICSTLQTALSSPPMLSIPAAVFVGLCAPVRTALFEDPGPMLPIGSAARTIADSLLAIATLIMASSLISLSGSLGGETLAAQVACAIFGNDGRPSNSPIVPCCSRQELRGLLDGRREGGFPTLLDVGRMDARPLGDFYARPPPLRPMPDLL